MEIILASASQRRQDLLKELVDNFIVVKSDFDEETISFEGNPGEYVKKVSKGKALKVYDNLNNPQGKVIISCDTVVYHEGRILGKPRGAEEAFHMLESLSGRTHEVYSGFTIYNCESNIIKEDFQCTRVTFMNLSKNEINEYINSGEPFDKAGAYGIQTGASKFIEKVEGCYFNVVGLPLNKLYLTLKGMGVIV